MLAHYIKTTIKLTPAHLKAHKYTWCRLKFYKPMKYHAII